MPHFTILAERHERYESRYFDLQSAYRYRVRLDDGQHVETSAYKHYLGKRPTALAIDVSTMIGCPLKCRYCAAGAIRFERALRVDEIVGQFAEMVRRHDQESFPVLNCSFQGIGEPSLLYQDVVTASEQVLALDPRAQISISTTAASEQTVRAWADSGLTFENLQLSCSATTNEQASTIAPLAPMPAAVFSVAKLARLLPAFRKVKVNYILIAGVNDSDQDFARLCDLAKGSSVIVKVSTLNRTAATDRFLLTSGERSRALSAAALLRANGVDSYVYGAFQGTTISCGQLLSNYKQRRRNVLGEEVGT